MQRFIQKAQKQLQDFYNNIQYIRHKTAMDVQCADQCFNAKGNRRIEINHNLQYLKAKAKENLESQEGNEIYAKRCVEPEPVFGNIKQNKHFKRFTLRKLPKINLEFGLIVIAHNFAKWIEKIRLLNFRQFNLLLNRFIDILSQDYLLNRKKMIAA